MCLRYPKLFVQRLCAVASVDFLGIDAVAEYCNYYIPVSRNRTDLALCSIQEWGRDFRRKCYVYQGETNSHGIDPSFPRRDTVRSSRRPRRRNKLSGKNGMRRFTYIVCGQGLDSLFFLFFSYLFKNSRSLPPLNVNKLIQ